MNANWQGAFVKHTKLFLSNFDELIEKRKQLLIYNIGDTLTIAHLDYSL